MINKTEAAQYLRYMMLLIQKARSNAFDGGLGSPLLDSHKPGRLDYTPELAAELMPYLFGDECPLPALVKILDSYERTGELAPIDFFNMMVILNQFLGPLAVFGAFYGYPEFPTVEEAFSYFAYLSESKKREQ